MQGGESVSKHLFVHDPSRPQAPGLDTDFKITVTNQRHLFLTKLDGDQHYDFKLVVAEPLSLGLPKLDDYHGDEFMRYVVMACNLVMEKAAFSYSLSDPSHVEVDRGSPPPSATRVETTPTGMRTATVDISVPPPTVSVSIGIGYIAELDEERVLDVLRKIRVVFGVGSNPQLKIHNLQKSLDRYFDSTQNTNVYRVFEGIYESLDLATNVDKPNRAGKKFDAAVHIIMADNTLPVEDLRLLNDRIKHADTEEKRVKFDANKDRMTEKIRTLRPITSGVILCRLDTTSADILHTGSTSGRLPEDKSAPPTVL